MAVVWRVFQDRKIKRIMETGINRTENAYQVWFRIDNQTFFLDPAVCEHGTLLESKQAALWYEKMLKIALSKIVPNIPSLIKDREYRFRYAESVCNTNMEIAKMLGVSERTVYRYQGIYNKKKTIGQ